MAPEVIQQHPPEQLVTAFAAVLDDVPPDVDAAEVERLAATLLIALEQPEMPRAVASAVVEAIAARGEPPRPAC
jgi:hypothetical protein